MVYSKCYRIFSENYIFLRSFVLELREKLKTILSKTIVKILDFIFNYFIIFGAFGHYGNMGFLYPTRLTFPSNKILKLKI